MPATIHSNAAFGAGGLVLQSHETRVAEDGFVEIAMNFACLATALDRQAANFRMESPPPVPLPADAAALSLQSGTVYLSAIETTAERGIGYLKALYVGVNLDQRRRITFAQVARSFSGTADFVFRNRADNRLFPVRSTITFDYTAERKSARWSSLSLNDKGPTLVPKILDKANENIDLTPPGGGTRGFDIVSFKRNLREKIVEESTATPVGPVYRFSKTAVALYEST